MQGNVATPCTPWVPPKWRRGAWPRAPTKPAKRFGLRLTGNFDHCTGLGQISGEPPAYGPLTWPLVTGTVHFGFPKAGRLSVDLQRTYYIEQIVTGNNFSANLLRRFTHMAESGLFMNF
jgi:hypothetical protein